MAGAPIAVAMPVHNGEEWLPATLDSLVGQDEPGPEVVIRDSTPGEGCERIVDAYRDRLAIDYAHCPEIKSWTRKTNDAARAATADHVCILHQDDLWLPGRLQIARELIERHPAATLICNPSLLVDARGRTVGQWRPPLPEGEVERATMLDRLIVQNFISMPSPVIRRDDWLAVGGMDESLWYTPDWDFYLKLARHGSVVYDPRPTTAFRIHGGSLTLTGDRKEFAEQLAAVLARHAPAVSPRASRIGKASVKVNTLLADAALGNLQSFAGAIGAVLRLGPGDAARYVRYSRILERTLPRLRLRLAGRL
jgi:glycosyltransferase involved in cell wall biosynthesis